MKNMKNEKETHCPPLLSTQLLLNNEVKINVGQFAGETALVRKVMADGRSLEVEIARSSGKIAFVDVTMVSEIQESYNWPKGEPDLGPIANSVVQAGR